MATPTIQVEAELSEADRRHAVDSLVAFNVANAGSHGFSELFVTLRQDGALVGTCLGKTYWRWLQVDILWVAEGFRGRGFGASLLGKAEDEGRHRGCGHVCLDTYGFQAPGFYAKLGYREFGRLPDYPKGHDRIFLTKEL